MRHASLFAIVLMLSACSIDGVPEDPTAAIDRIIDAPRDAVFDKIESPANFPAFELVTRGGTSRRYKINLTEDNMIAFIKADAAPIFDKFANGSIVIIIEANSLAAVELRSANDATKMRYNLHFADEENGTKTRVTSEIDKRYGPLSGEQRAQMDSLQAMMASMVGVNVIDYVERELRP